MPSVEKKRYHFSLGNSSKGPIGFCAAVWATGKEEAVEKLRRALPENLEIPLFTDDEDIEYAQAYFNESAVTARGIDDVEGADPEECTDHDDSHRSSGCPKKGP